MKIIAGKRYRFRGRGFGGKMKRFLFLFEDVLEDYRVFYIKLFFILYDFIWYIFEFKF